MKSIVNFFRGWLGWRRFRKLPPQWRNIVIYSETGQDWHQFAGLIAELTENLGQRVCYVTSDAGDAGLSYEHPHYTSLFLPDGLFLTIFFQFKRCDLCVVTFMDLDNLNLKRSINPVHYVYLFHSMGSTHMVDHANSFDAYDTLFCAGPHQVSEIRRREELADLPGKELYDFGHPRLEDVIRQGAETEPRVGATQEKVVLIAPGWGENSIFNYCGEELITVLLDAGFRVIMRPHYQSIRQTPQIIEKLRKGFEAHERFEYIDQMGETDSIVNSDVLVSDWSAMALEYALGLERPVLFVDVPRRIRNPDWRDWDMEPVESSIRDAAGAIISPDSLEQAPQMIERLLQHPSAFREQVRALRDKVVFRLGHAIPDGARKLAEMATQLKGHGTGSDNG